MQRLRGYLNTIRQGLHTLNVIDPARLEIQQTIHIALSRAAIAVQLRATDPTEPATWEFSVFSQNGEDGIIDFLLRQLTESNRYFVEIGTGNGLENNTTWLLARKYAGLMIDGRTKNVECLAHTLLPALVLGQSTVTCECLFVTVDAVPDLAARLMVTDPDVFSLDIDGVDWYIAERLLQEGIRPKIFVVEYNATLGPDNSLAVSYRDDFDYQQLHDSLLYYGASITAWQRLFQRHGYRFVTVETNGVNAFFVRPDSFDPGFLEAIHGLPFQENRYQQRRLGGTWRDQFAHVSAMPWVEVP